MKNLKKLLISSSSTPLQINENYFYGNVLKLLREEKNLTQVYISDRTNFKQSYISNIERGIKNPSSDFLKAFAKELEIDISDLIIAIMKDYQNFIDIQKKIAEEEIARLTMEINNIDNELGGNNNQLVGNKKPTTFIITDSVKNNANAHMKRTSV